MLLSAARPQNAAFEGAKTDFEERLVICHAGENIHRRILRDMRWNRASRILSNSSATLSKSCCERRFPSSRRESGLSNKTLRQNLFRDIDNKAAARVPCSRG